MPQCTCEGPKSFAILTDDTKVFVSNCKSVDDNTLSHSHSGDPTEILQNSLYIQAE